MDRKVVFKGENLKDLLYEYSRKPDDELSVQDLHDYYVRRGGDPDHKLRESEIEAIRILLNNYRRNGDFLMLPYEERRKMLFVPDEEIIEIMKKAMIPQILESQKNAIYRHCGVCMKKVNHRDVDCPYITNEVPNPDTTEVGSKYVIKCHDCNREKDYKCDDHHGHEPGYWTGYAFPKGMEA